MKGRRPKPTSIPVLDLEGPQALLRVWRDRRSDYNLSNVIRVSNWH